jgi:hypothetical protein
LGPPPYQREGGRLVATEAPSPMNKAARQLCRAALPWARCFPRGVRFYKILRSKLKPDAIATSVTIYFRWGSASPGSPSAAMSSAVRAPGHRNIAVGG